MAYQNMSMYEDSDRIDLEDYLDDTNSVNSESTLMFKTRFKDGQTGDEYTLFESRLCEENDNVLLLDSPSRDTSFVVNKYKGLGIIEKKVLDMYERIPWVKSGTWVWPFGKLRTVYVQNNKIFCELGFPNRDDAQDAVLELVKIKVKTSHNYWFQFNAFVGPQDINKRYVRHLLAKRFKFSGDNVTQFWLEEIDKYWTKIKIEVEDLYVLTPFNHTEVEDKWEMEDWS